jgi:peptidoglycan-associated lipoprotein
MKQTILSMLLVLLLAACASQGQRGAEIEARRLSQRQAEQEQILREQAEQAQILREEALKREREEQERRLRGESPMIDPLTGNPVSVGRPLGDPGGKQVDLLSNRSIYYDYDRYDIKEEFIPMIEAHANFLVKNPGFRIAVQGNCDDRGSREYNLALGQRRADGVKRAMVLLGVGDKRIEAVSLGAEKPVAMGRDDASWAKNRRSDVVYVAAPGQ